MNQSSLFQLLIALSFYDVVPNPVVRGGVQDLALNLPKIGKHGIDTIREIDSNLKTDEQTKANEDCVFSTVGGGFASGGLLGSFAGGFLGPVGAAAGAALGASFGGVLGAVAHYRGYCVQDYNGEMEASIMLMVADNVVGKK